MLTCDECGLSEDEDRDGRFLVRQHGGDGPDTGLRFVPDKTDEERFTCPACGTELRLDPFEDFDGWCEVGARAILVKNAFLAIPPSKASEPSGRCCLNATGCTFRAIATFKATFLSRCLKL
jgi:hypothetical protein